MSETSDRGERRLAFLAEEPAPITQSASAGRTGDVAVARRSIAETAVAYRMVRQFHRRSLSLWGLQQQETHGGQGPITRLR